MRFSLSLLFCLILLMRLSSAFSLSASVPWKEGGKEKEKKEKKKKKKRKKEKKKNPNENPYSTTRVNSSDFVV